MIAPKWGGLREKIIRECHNAAGSPSVQRTLVELKRGYYWPHMQKDVERYVKTCPARSQDRMELKRQAGGPDASEF